MMDKSGVALQLNQKFLVGSPPSDNAYPANWNAHYIPIFSAVTTGNANAPVTVAMTYE
ncbi:hypothetical protein [Citrobacter amalonaticus]|uniref:hypothetical protein n=1 Tax=Citrobacter amalonaticus TaxID=35703 RepID=UPI00300C0B81